MLKNKPLTRLTLIGILLFMSRGMTVPISSVVWRSMGANYVAIGLLGTVNAVVMIIASPLWGRASDRAGQRRRFLRIGLILLALASAGVLVLPDSGYAWLFPLLALMSMAQAAYSTSSLALMGDWLEYQRHRTQENGASGRRMGLYRGLASLGFGATAFISGSIADHFSLRTPFGLSALFLLCAFLLSLGVREAPEIPAIQESQQAHDADPLPASRSQLPLTPLLVAALVWALAFGAVYAVWGNYMVDSMGYTPTQMTRLWAVASLSEFPLMILAGWLSDRVGRLPMLAIGFAAWSLVFLGYLSVPFMPWIVLVQLLRGFAFSAHTATSMTYATEVRARAERGRVSGMYDTAGALGSILGSSVGGGIAQYLGFPTLIGAGAGLFLAAALYMAGMVLLQRKRDSLLLRV